MDGASSYTNGSRTSHNTRNGLDGSPARITAYVQSSGPRQRQLEIAPAVLCVVNAQADAQRPSMQRHGQQIIVSGAL